VARWGGEEFLIVLANTAMPTGVTVLERVRRDVAAIRVPVSKPGEAPLSFSFSAGIAQARAGETSQQLLERTDQAMYRAKREGRDRVVVA
jgi:diguanylate cyclase (GGDEF)-like protein